MKRELYDTTVWRAVKADIETDLAAARTALEGMYLAPEKTQVLRGRIAALKSLLARESAPADEASGRRGDHVALADDETD